MASSIQIPSSGSVSSVGETFTGGLISVAGSPVTTTGSLDLTVAGTSGGVPYFSGATTWASSGALTANLPVIGGGAGVAPAVGTRSGSTTAFVTTTGTQTSGDCVKIDASGNHIANGSACGGGITVGDTQVLFADGANTPAGDAGMTYAKASDALTLAGAVIAAHPAVGTAATDGLVASNATAAAAGAQQYSPALRWTGQGWKTDATAASQAVDWIAQVVPVEGAATPTSLLKFSSQVNGGGYSVRGVLTSTGVVSTSNSFTRGIGDYVGQTASMDNANAAPQPFIASQFIATGAEMYRFGDPNSAVYARLSSSASMLIKVADDGTNIGEYLVGGALTSVTSVANACGTTAPALGANSINSAGAWTVGATSGTSCLLTFSVAAPHFWNCTFSNETSGLIVHALRVSTTTTSAVGVFGAADVVNYVCKPY